MLRMPCKEVLRGVGKPIPINIQWGISILCRGSHLHHRPPSTLSSATITCFRASARATKRSTSPIKGTAWGPTTSRALAPKSSWDRIRGTSSNLPKGLISAGNCSFDPSCPFRGHGRSEGWTLPRLHRGHRSRLGLAKGAGRTRLPPTPKARRPTTSSRWSLRVRESRPAPVRTLRRKKALTPPQKAGIGHTLLLAPLTIQNMSSCGGCGRMRRRDRTFRPWRRPGALSRVRRRSWSRCPFQKWSGRGF